MPSKKKLARQVRWLEKALTQYERGAPRLEFECEQACGERDRALSELFRLRAAAGHVANELADIDLDATPELAEQVRVLRGLLDMDDQAPTKRACRETIKKIRTIDFRDTQVTSVNPAKFGEPGTILINGDASTTASECVEGCWHQCPACRMGLVTHLECDPQCEAPTIAGMQIGDRGWVAPWAVFQHEGLVWLRGQHIVHSVQCGLALTLVERRADGYCVWYSKKQDPRRGMPSAEDVPATTFWFGLPSEEAA